MAKFLSAWKNKDPSDWSLRKFQVLIVFFFFLDSFFCEGFFCFFIYSFARVCMYGDFPSEQEAFSESCMEIKKQQMQSARQSPSIELEDMLVPEKLCNISAATMGSWMRLANLLEDSMDGQLAIQNYMKPFVSNWKPASTSAAMTIIALDVSIVVRNPWFASLHNMNGDAASGKLILVYILPSGYNNKNKSLFAHISKKLVPCECPPATCLCQNLL